MTSTLPESPEEAIMTSVTEKVIREQFPYLRQALGLPQLSCHSLFLVLRGPGERAAVNCSRR